MRIIFSLAILFCTAIATAQEPLSYKTLEYDDDLNFPVFASKNPITAQNINYLLQLSELNIIDGYYKENIFENVMPDKDGIGSYDIDFEVKENSPRLLSVRFNLSTCGATCHYATSCYNFNPQTGEPIQLGDLFTADGLEQYNSALTARWAAQIDAGVKDDLAEDIEAVQEFKECFDDSYTQLQNFYVEKNNLFIDAENCLPKFAKFYDVDTQVRFTLKELTPLLSDYGKAVLGISGKGVGNFKSEHLLRELKIYRNKENDAILGIATNHEGIICYYADKKEGVYYITYLDPAEDGFFDDTIAVEIKENEAAVYYINAENGQKKPAILLIKQ